MAVVAAFGTVCGAKPVGAAAPLALMPASKASVLLGGAASELDRIRMEQEGVAAVTLARAAAVNFEIAPPVPLAPAAAAPVQTSACLDWLQPRLAMPAAPAIAAAPASGDIFASKRLAIGRTSFDADWARVSRERIGAGQLTRLIGAVPSDEGRALVQVNAWVNRNIAYVEDRDLFGRGDYWAGAARTLRLRKGDCEDIALTKMQLLAAAGIPREHMMLTIAKDLVRGADHAVLIVKQGDGYVMLDNATDAVLDASAANDYRPVLSFGPRQAWLHGYQTASLGTP